MLTNIENWLKANSTAVIAFIGGLFAAHVGPIQSIWNFLASLVK